MFVINSVWSQSEEEERSNKYGGGVQYTNSNHYGKKEETKMKDFYFEDFEIAMKVVIVGNGSVGKSSMIQRFCRGIFTREYKKTIGVDFLERILTIVDQPVRLMLWDTAGQEEFDAITRTYYRGANACVLACSITDRDSFLALPKWKAKVCRECGENIPIVLIANKMDLQKQAVVDSSELEAMAKSLGIKKLFRTSVKEDVNVNSVFTYLSEQFVETVMCIRGEEARMLDEEELLPPDLHNGFIHNNNHHQNNKKKKAKKERPVKNNNRDNMSQSNNPQLRNPVILKGGTPFPAFHHGGYGGGGGKKKGLAVIGNEFDPRQPIYHHRHSSNTNTGYHYGHLHPSALNMPFRLDLVNKGAKKRKKDVCAIL